MLEISARKVAQVAMMGRELNRAEGELRAFVGRMSEELFRRGSGRSHCDSQS
jgi:hypothetical protein